VLVLVWAATAGPALVLGRSGGGPAVGTSSPSASATATRPGAGTYRQLTRHVHPVVDLSWLGQLIAYAALLGVAFVCLLALRALWHAARRDQWLRRRRAPRSADVPFEVLPDRDATTVLEEDAAAALEAVEVGGPRDGIVACWLRLEETVAAGGVRRRPSETSTELVTRVLHALDVDPRPVAVLAELYREARFSEHPMTEGSRDRARSALRSVREDAARLRAGT
jgi:hypothetical protein